jgi:hypothetical protein
VVSVRSEIYDERRALFSVHGEVSQENEMVRSCNTDEKMRNAYEIFVGNPEVKIPLRMSRHRWGANNGMDLREIRWKVVDWINLAQDRDQWRALVNKVTNLWAP